MSIRFDPSADPGLPSQLGKRGRAKPTEEERIAIEALSAMRSTPIDTLGREKSRPRVAKSAAGSSPLRPSKTDIPASRLLRPVARALRFSLSPVQEDAAAILVPPRDRVHRLGAARGGGAESPSARSGRDSARLDSSRASSELKNELERARSAVPSVCWESIIGHLNPAEMAAVSGVSRRMHRIAKGVLESTEQLTKGLLGAIGGVDAYRRLPSMRIVCPPETSTHDDVVDFFLSHIQFVGETATLAQQLLPATTQLCTFRRTELLPSILPRVQTVLEGVLPLCQRSQFPQLQQLITPIEELFKAEDGELKEKVDSLLAITEPLLRPIREGIVPQLDPTTTPFIKGIITFSGAEYPYVAALFHRSVRLTTLELSPDSQEGSTSVANQCLLFVREVTSLKSGHWETWGGSYLNNLMLTGMKSGPHRDRFAVNELGSRETTRAFLRAIEQLNKDKVLRSSFVPPNQLDTHEEAEFTPAWKSH